VKSAYKIINIIVSEFLVLGRFTNVRQQQRQWIKRRKGSVLKTKGYKFASKGAFFKVCVCPECKKLGEMILPGSGGA